MINAAGWVRVDEAEAEPHGCYLANRDGAIALADQCSALGIPTVNFSSDLVFDGAKSSPYLEEDAVAPLGVYGLSKGGAEARILALDGAHLVIRTAAFFSPEDPHNFAYQAVTRLLAGERFGASAEHVVSPTYVPHLCDAVLDLLIDGATGLWHLAGDTPMSWYDFARRLAECCELDGGLIERVSPEMLGWVAERPLYAALGTSRGRRMPRLDVAIEQFRHRLPQLQRSPIRL